MHSYWFKLYWDRSRPLAGDAGQSPQTCRPVVPPLGDSSRSNPTDKFPTTTGQSELSQRKVSCITHILLTVKTTNSDNCTSCDGMHIYLAVVLLEDNASNSDQGSKGRVWKEAAVE